MINYDLKKIRAIVFDVDGVLSTSTVQMNEQGDPIRTLNIKDGYAIQLALKLGLHLAIMTGGHNDNVRKRYEYLGVKDIYMNCSVKLDSWTDFLEKYQLHEDEVMYVGDDIPDFEVMQHAGCPCCPHDACIEIKAISLYISDCLGGYGVARDVIEQVLKAQQKWMTTAKAFGW